MYIQEYFSQSHTFVLSVGTIFGNMYYFNLKFSIVCFLQPFPNKTFLIFIELDY